MTDGINLDGFTANRHPAGTNSINETGTWSPASGGDFGAGLSWPAAQDMSSQGDAGLGQEGSSGSLPLSGPDTSDALNVSM